MSTTTAHLSTQLADQLDWHWRNQLRPRLDGLTDDEYFWQPVPDCWTVRRAGAQRPGNGPGRDGGIDFAFPPPEPEPFTTIAWRLAHVIAGVLAVRAHAHFDGPAADYQSWTYATDAATAQQQLDDAYANWTAGVQTLAVDAIARPVGPAEGQWADKPMIELVLHINREMIHHGAEIALLRDLYAHTKLKEN